MIDAILNNLLNQYLVTTNHNIENIIKESDFLQVMQSSSLHTRCKWVNMRVEQNSLIESSSLELYL